MRNMFIPCILFILLVFFACSGIAYADAEECSSLTGTEIPFGDINNDGSITTNDTVLLMRYCCGLFPLDAFGQTVADVNVDGNANTADAVILLKMNAGLVDHLPFIRNKKASTSMTFLNFNLPTDGDRLTYQQAYQLKAAIQSDTPIYMVRVVITDIATGTAEVDKSIYLEQSENHYMYYTWKDGATGIDSHIAFASLTAGRKRIEVMASSVQEAGRVLYSSEFNIGFTFMEIGSYVYDKEGKLSIELANELLTEINKLDFTNDSGAKIIANALERLGTPYKTADCSKMVQQCIQTTTGVSLPRKSVDQALYCTENGLTIDESSKRAGDLIYRGRTYCDCGRWEEVHHCAIYLCTYKGTDYVVESTGALNGTIIRHVWGGSRWRTVCMARIYSQATAEDMATIELAAS